ncbi:nicotinamide riboside transporter PnuC [Streptococcus gallolyticus subsp. gallolyticus]|uniref:nicotinamide riboside transporter PnuC n=1 Tax=Streptococcus gallolyticus TaxID=315405 RepID=UPI00200174FC|nr:nicotinamide riboside transporter PnuC [Streptococcus gallolyticus]MCY7155677.1 nicotinamide riboside transporter PnuC [Streptococcus gallolyticus subsp. gallolyticus]MCY7174441.1 nicotinamide riboside transporter PnuC [Streptococcus gallolyticus subsp. gallolyticus]MCY7177003.1 nicotinamide riboside transporter PnuC [Streptococcus gallolyticus subsp. gallolyticus]MCY7181467.1 nicotinamide riboside transporter PnuC [Streptococcus gallolyticus subsp. gallolyticus]MCY7199111.1 nicotinamide ri
MKKQLSLKNSFNLAWNRLNTKEKLFVIIAFLASLSFTLYGMLPTLVTGDFTALNTLSIIMSIFGFIGTWTLALQWQHTFKANGIQNIAGILVAGMQGIYGDMFTSFYYLVTEFIGHYSWKKRRNDNGELVVDKKFGVKDVFLAIFFWTIGLGFLSYWMGGQKIVLDALTNGLSFTAQQRQVKGHLDGYYIWLLVDFLSFMLFISIGNQIVAFSYLGMFAQGLVGIMIWKKGKGQA